MRHLFPACDNKWHHVAMTHGDLQLGPSWYQTYIDGLPGIALPSASSITPVQQLFIGWSESTR